MKGDQAWAVQGLVTSWVIRSTCTRILGDPSMFKKNILEAINKDTGQFCPVKRLENQPKVNMFQFFKSACKGMRL